MVRVIVMVLGIVLSFGVMAGESFAAGKKKPAAAAKKEKTLYERFFAHGKTLDPKIKDGKAVIGLVVDEFVSNVAADNRINAFFAKTNIPKLKANLVDQICQASGGPCQYKGMDMKTAHNPARMPNNMKITDEHFNALVEDLVKALDKFKVPEKEKGELLGALGPMKGDIVQGG